MAAVLATIDRHHRGIIASSAFVIVFFAVACALNEAIPICHYLFGCDHAFHAA
jgi:hypothetical protein